LIIRNCHGQFFSVAKKTGLLSDKFAEKRFQLSGLIKDGLPKICLVCMAEFGLSRGKVNPPLLESDVLCAE
jgi:hypothetical protein